MPPPDLSKGPPPVPLDLVEWLEAVYPDRFPSDQALHPDALGPNIYRQAGRLDVVRLLRDHLSRQSKFSKS